MRKRIALKILNQSTRYSATKIASAKKKINARTNIERAFQNHLSDLEKIRLANEIMRLTSLSSNVKPKLKKVA